MGNFVIVFLLLKVLSNKDVFAETEVDFYLYNGSNTSAVSQIFIGNEKSLEKLQPALPVRIIIHGWKGSHISYPINILRNAYLQKGNLNIIVIHWPNAYNDNYFLVTLSLKQISQILANMIKFLNEKANIKFSNIYLIGHSLGAHLAGLTGRNLKPQKLNTIFALDPARFLTDNLDFIKSDDADYVEVIHTNVEPFGVGAVETIGSTDFYPNYGKMQEHCTGKLIEIACNHFASVLYLAESINSNIGFYGIECTNFRILKIGHCQCKDNNNEECQKFKMGGEPSTKDKPNGSYYLKTNSQFPFAIGK